MIISANFKTNHTRESFISYMNKLNEIKTNHKIRVYPPFTALEKGQNSLNVKIGVQNFYPIKNGSFTGEIGKDQLDEFDINAVLIGHSERRHILGESDDLIEKKFDFAKKNGWEVSFCIGESKGIRDKGEQAVLDYLQKQLKNIDLNYKELILAYEPVWAIGTGDVATLKDIKTVLDFLRTKTQAPLLYGGSVKPTNVNQIYELQNCDGVLVGTASWEAKSFMELIKKAG